MKSVLACLRDPVKLGIKGADGKWNDLAFRRHRRKCWKCKMISGDSTGVVLWLRDETDPKRRRFPGKEYM
jgi:hypothetical protein